MLLNKNRIGIFLKKARRFFSTKLLGRKSAGGLLGTSSSGKSASGFTLIETLVGIAVLAVAMTGPMTMASKSLSSAYMAKNRVKAAFLAQDAMEYVRHQRDSNFLNDGSGWLDGMSNCVTSDASKKCTVDTTEGSPSQAFKTCGGTCDKLKYTDSSGTYHHKNNSGTQTKFTRFIIMEKISSKEVEVTVKIGWQGVLDHREFVFKESMYKWW